MFNSSFIQDISKRRVKGLHLTICRYSSGFFSDRLFAHYNIFSPEKITLSEKVRQSEYLAGRIAAKLSLEEFNISNFPIVSDLNRCPIWPENLTGSITHTRTFAICAVAEKNSIHSVGIDLEEVVCKKNASDIFNHVLNTNERYLLKAFGNCCELLLLTIVFSAKESIFKALYPSAEELFNFSAAEVQSIDLEEGKLVFQIKEELCNRFYPGILIDCSFEKLDAGIFTVVLV